MISVFFDDFRGKQPNAIVIMQGTLVDTGQFCKFADGGDLSREAYIRLQKYALGRLFFRLSNIKITDEVAV